MENLINTLVLGAVIAAAFPIAFLAARFCLMVLVRALPPRSESPPRHAAFSNRTMSLEEERSSAARPPF